MQRAFRDAAAGSILAPDDEDLTMGGAAFRLSFFYAAFFTFGGIHLPFWPVWLAAKGIEAAEIAAIIAAGIGVKVIVNPVVAHFADRSGGRKSIMLILAAAATALFSVYAVADGFLPILLITVLFFALWSPVMPLGESLTMLAARAGAFDYGRVRLWGSIAFIAAAFGAGVILEGRPGEIVLWLLIPASLLALLSVAMAPDARAPATAPGRIAALELLRDRGFLLILLACALVQSSHAAYYSFGTLHWRAAGHSEAVIGALWAEGVVAEIVLFAAGPAILKRVSPGGLILLAALAGIVRWTATAMSTALPLLAAAQILHAFTFGAAHLGAIHLIARHVAPALSASAQSLYSATVMGLGLSLAILAAGPLYNYSSIAAFLVMAALSALAAAAAYPLIRALQSAPARA